jgi:hypothetical protein
MLHRYSGERFHEHFGLSLTGYAVRSTYGRDVSGTISYRFDDLGFRCSTTEAPAAIHVCGCSYTFGVGLKYEQTWPSVFASLYNERCAEKTGVANFSQGAASNRYIARTLLTQAEAVRPRAIVALFSHVGRTEYIVTPAERALIGAGPITRHAENLGTIAALPKYSVNWLRRQRLSIADIPAGLRPLTRHFLAWARSYYEDSYTDARALFESIESLLLVQYFCESRGIEYLMSWVDHARLSEPWIVEHSALGPMVRLLNRERLVDFSLLDVLVDRAADGSHPGPRSNEIFAQRLWERFAAVAR